MSILGRLSIFAVFVFAVILSQPSISQAKAKDARVGPSNTASVYTAVGLSGKVCVTIKDGTGNDGEAEFFNAIGKKNLGRHTGNACFNFTGGIKLKARNSLTPGGVVIHVTDAP
jgi:hypothetical protein